ncbi:MAG: bis(5'-nucleosyl)-tetraphosphatase (symmetrical) YqeK [bacterium]|nr:bis(5'-nucleosyl)-tetraphosphatase (symmetrical) YqeK [bacterium]
MDLSSDQLELLRSLMSEKRFAHCERVADMAVRLAARWGANAQQAYLAGMLHDAAKEMSVERVQDLGIAIPKEHRRIISHFFPIWHAFIGPDVVRKLFECDDDVVLDAIYWHTTGDGDMALLSQLLFVADYIEDGRPWPYRRDLERLAFENLDEATWAVSVLTNKRVREKGAVLYVASEACASFYKRRVSEARQDDIMAFIPL